MISPVRTGEPVNLARAPHSGFPAPPPPPARRSIKSPDVLQNHPKCCCRRATPPSLLFDSFRSCVPPVPSSLPRASSWRFRFLKLGSGFLSFFFLIETDSSGQGCCPVCAVNLPSPWGMFLTATYREGPEIFELVPFFLRLPTLSRPKLQQGQGLFS